jgi:CRP-like cAMP-binding protein
MFDSLKKSISDIQTLTDEEFSVIYTALAFKRLKKHEHLLREGEICRHVAFVNKGVLRLFHQKDGKQHTTHFCLDGQWISNYSSFLQQTPSQSFIEAHEEAEVFLITYENLQKLYRQIPALERFGRMLAEQLFIKIVNRNELLVLLTPEERYLKLLKEQPRIFQIVPLKQIASLLCIEPESLSRIRKRLSTTT